jgi:hypothetical protein
MRVIPASIVVALTSLIVVSNVEAQQGYSSCSATGGTVVGEDVLINVPSGPSTPVVSPFPGSGQVLPYSYWVSAPAPARIYVAYGAVDQFPFQGRPYGRPNDRWSWYNMGGGSERYLAKYYYPLLP